MGKPATSSRSTRKMPTAKAIRRTVASSTAIETGCTTVEIERRLRKKSVKSRKINLAE